jgi:hypothetical protein
MLYPHCDIHALERIVNDELGKACLWLEANKLTLNIIKSNYVIFDPCEKKTNYNPQIIMIQIPKHSYHCN